MSDVLDGDSGRDLLRGGGGEEEALDACVLIYGTGLPYYSYSIARIKKSPSPSPSTFSYYSISLLLLVVFQGDLLILE